MWVLMKVDRSKGKDRKVGNNHCVSKHVPRNICAKIHAPLTKTYFASSQDGVTIAQLSKKHDCFASPEDCGVKDDSGLCGKYQKILPSPLPKPCAVVSDEKWASPYVNMDTIIAQDTVNISFEMLKTSKVIEFKSDTGFSVKSLIELISYSFKRWYDVDNYFARVFPDSLEHRKYDVQVYSPRWELLQISRIVYDPALHLVRFETRFDA